MFTLITLTIAYLIWVIISLITIGFYLKYEYQTYHKKPAKPYIDYWMNHPEEYTRFKEAYKKQFGKEYQ